jgi:excisionase family DNA binding protein
VNEPALDPLLSVDDASTVLGLRPKTVRAWARRGDLPCIVLRRGSDGRGTGIRFRRAALEKWIAAHELKTQPRQVKP